MMAPITLKTANHVVPMIYAYTTPEIIRHNGWTKIGYTEQDVEKRLEAHRSGKGAKYTRGRGPLALVYQECCGSHSHGLKREWEVKALTRQEKMALIQGQQNSGEKKYE